MSAESMTEKLIQLIEPMLQPLGYEIVHLEAQTQREKILRIFIENSDGRKVGIEDCVKVTRALDEPLDQVPEVDQAFQGPYELEVSSPGLDRPLRRPKDYDRFTGQEVRIHVFRPLTAEELGNPAYQAKNPKQKNFLGTLMGIESDSGADSKVRLSLSAGHSDNGPGKPGKKGKTAKPKTNKDEVTIPLPLISKANLEPDFSKLESGELPVDERE